MSPLARDIRIATSALVVLTFIAIAGSLYFLRPVLVPFILALFLASGLQPVLSYLERVLKISRVFALFVALALSIFATLIIWSVIGYSVAELTKNKLQYQNRLDDVIDRTVGQFWVATGGEPTDEDTPHGDATESDKPAVDANATPAVSGISDTTNNTDDNVKPDVKSIEESIKAASGNKSSPTTFPRPSKQVLDLLVVQLQADSRIIIEKVSSELYGLVTNGLLVMIFLFFLLLGSRIEVPADNLWNEVDTHVRNYIVTKSVISLFTALAFWFVLWLFGVPMAVVFGLLAFLLNFIPNIGPVIATLLPIPLLILDPNFTTVDPESGQTVWRWGWALTALIASGFVQFASGNLIEPRILGDKFKLHPIAILLSLIFWSIIWGLPGAFLAVPITSALKIMLHESDRTRPVAMLLEGDLAMFKRHASQAVA